MANGVSHSEHERWHTYDASRLVRVSWHAHAAQPRATSVCRWQLSPAADESSTAAADDAPADDWSTRTAIEVPIRPS